TAWRAISSETSRTSSVNSAMSSASVSVCSKSVVARSAPAASERVSLDVFIRQPPSGYCPLLPPLPCPRQQQHVPQCRLWESRHRVQTLQCFADSRQSGRRHVHMGKGALSNVAEAILVRATQLGKCLAPLLLNLATHVAYLLPHLFLQLGAHIG